MNGEVFKFRNVLVVARGNNIFTEQLKEHNVEYASTDDDHPDRSMTDQPDLIILVNKGREIAKAFKKAFLKAQVVICRGGGTKAFASRVAVVHESGQIDTHWFNGWGGFFKLIGQTIEPLPVLIESLGSKTDRHRICRPVTTNDVVHPDLSDRFHAMFNVSHSYLEWYMRWIKEVMEMEFFCEFNFPKKRGWVKRVVIPIEERHEYMGMPVFREEARVIFHDYFHEEYPATVKSVGETEIVFVFDHALNRQTANSLVMYQVEIGSKITAAQKSYSDLISRQDNLTGPLAVLAGQEPNNRAEVHTELFLSKRQAEMLSQDRSQMEALLGMVSSRTVSNVIGPAGTGKSFLTSVGVLQFVKMGKVILLLSHSNQGLDNLVSFVADNTGQKAEIFRLGNNENNITDAGIRFHRSQRFREKSHQFDERTIAQREAEHIRDLIDDGQSVILACTMSSYVIDETLGILRDYAIGIQVTFIDEASRGFMYELLPAIKDTKERIIFVGDPDQLGNIDITPEAKNYLVMQGNESKEIERFSNGWFNTMTDEGLLPSHLLNINRRSLPEINALVSQLFYDGKLIAGRFDPNDAGLIIFHDTSQAANCCQKQIGTSWSNGREATLVVERMVNLLASGKFELDEMGVITPYRSQNVTVRGKLRKELIFNKRLQSWRDRIGFDVTKNAEMLEEILSSTVNTVDAFQGSQRKVIILSMVRTNDDGEIGFTKQINRLRVAFSRAQTELDIFASAKTFVKNPDTNVQEIFNTLIASARRLKAYQRAA